MKVSVDNVATIPELPLQPNTLQDTVKVNGLPPGADTELLKLYFESPRSGSHNGAVEKCFIVAPGTAHIKFQNPEGTQYMYTTIIFIIIVMSIMKQQRVFTCNP